jgi:hypothetical protein
MAWLSSEIDYFMSYFMQELFEEISNETSGYARGNAKHVNPLQHTLSHPKMSLWKSLKFFRSAYEYGSK